MVYLFLYLVKYEYMTALDTFLSTLLNDEMLNDKTDAIA